MTKKANIPFSSGLSCNRIAFNNPLNLSMLLEFDQRL